jgi:hypothetical protein
MKIKKMPTAKAMPSKAAKHAPPPLKKMDTDAGKRPMESVKKPKALRTRKI